MRQQAVFSSSPVKALNIIGMELEQHLGEAAEELQG